MEKIKVIICEDHSLFREGIKSYLNSKDNVKCVGEAENGAQLLHKLKYCEEDKFPDIVLLDINMPVMDGMETLKRLREEYKTLKVIVLTMHNEVSMVSKMMSLGANSYIPKTEASDQIMKAITSVYETDFYFNDLTNRAIVETMRSKRIYENEDIEVRPTRVEPVQEKTEKRGFFSKKVLYAALYGFVAAVVLTVVVYTMVKISGNLGSISNLNTYNFKY